MCRENLQRLDANRGREPCKDGILLLPLFPKGRRGSGRGGSFFSLPLSPALSPLVPSRGEREAKDATLILRFMESPLSKFHTLCDHEPTPPRRGSAKGLPVAHSPLGRGAGVGWFTGIRLAFLMYAILCSQTLRVCLGAAPRPNVVFILIDDLRHDTFGFMNHPFIETPKLDALAEKGAVFTHAFVTTSLCSPARASFLTGQYMHHHKVVDNRGPVPDGTVTFPQLLQRGGYDTAFVGKWHMGGSSDAPRPGFNHWVSFRGQGRYSPDNQFLNVDGRRVAMKQYMTDELTNYAVDWLMTREGKNPFLLYLSHKGVHGLYDPAPRHFNRYKNAQTGLPATDSDDSETPIWVKDQRNSWRGVEFPYYGRSGQTVEEMYRHYCEMILSVDDSVGEVVRTLHETGAEGNTFVVFTSDGGHLWGEHGLIDKRCAYEESIRIPMIVYGPEYVRAGVRIGELVANIDLAPTVLELAGLMVPDFMDGKFSRISRWITRRTRVAQRTALRILLGAKLSSDPDYVCTAWRTLQIHPVLRHMGYGRIIRSRRRSIRTAQPDSSARTARPSGRDACAFGSRIEKDRREFHPARV